MITASTTGRCHHGRSRSALRVDLGHAPDQPLEVLDGRGWVARLTTTVTIASAPNATIAPQKSADRATRS